MRPTIDEQLSGAARLLRLAEADPESTPAVVEVVRNARRLVERVGSSRQTAEPFLREDNVLMAALLSTDPAESVGLESTAQQNEQLRADLTRRIRELPSGPERAAIGTYLRARVDADAT